MPKSFLYTGTGDKGTTSLIGDVRIAKDSIRLEAYGTVDEFSSFLGCVISNPECPKEEKENLLEIQNKLFHVGAYLATQVKENERNGIEGLNENEIRIVEKWIDRLDEAVPPLRSFILPGGSELAAQTHVARSVCRRAERRIVTLSLNEFVDPLVLEYMNRLSDYLFILARYVNFISDTPEICWKK